MFSSQRAPATHADRLVSTPVKVIGFDLFGEAVTWDVLPVAATTILCVTHGHPEHCGSLRRFLFAGDARLDRTHVISSRPVIDHVTLGLNHAANAHPLTSGASVTIAACA